MRHTSLLRTIPLSFHSAALYREVGQEWLGFGFGYVLFLIFLLSLPITFVFSAGIVTQKPEMASQIDYVVGQMPVMSFKNGELSVPGPEPYIIRAAKEGTMKEAPTVVIIDTAHNVTEPNSSTFRGLIFGKTQALSRNSATESKLYDYPQTLNYVLTRETMLDWGNIALGWAWTLPWFCLPFMVIGIFLYRIVQLFIYGLFGILIANLTKTKPDVTYTSSVRLAAVALTPALCLDAILTYLLHIHLWGIVYFLLAMGYLCFAMKANKPHV